MSPCRAIRHDERSEVHYTPDMDISPEWDKAALLRSLPFEPLHRVITRLPACFPTLGDLNALLADRHPPITVRSERSLRFVPQAYGKLPLEAQYEPRCYLKGEVQTRADNWHDLLNALVWLTFPKAKAAINARHFHALTEVGADRTGAMSSQRGAVRDMNTLFDESGVIVPCADPELAELLRDFRWKELFWERRGRVRSGMGFCLFGHGLYEKALRPYVGMTGQGLLLLVEEAFFSWPQERQLTDLDDRLAGYLSAPGHCRSTRELTPVPLLGVPGWATESESAEFYDNIDYFRPGRRSDQLA